MLPRVWFTLVIVLLAALALLAQRGIGVETNLLSLLPSFQKEPRLQKTVERFAEQVTPRLIFMVGHKNPEQARTAAKKMAVALRNSGHFASLEAEIQQNTLETWQQFYFPHRYRMLSPEIRKQLTWGTRTSAGGTVGPTMTSWWAKTT